MNEQKMLYDKQTVAWFLDRLMEVCHNPTDFCNISYIKQDFVSGNIIASEVAEQVYKVLTGIGLN